MPLDAIKLANLSQVKVTPSASNATRPYGRRFTVTIGTDAPQEVVFKDLYKNAQELVKQAKNSGIKDLSEINAYIAKLEGAEHKAQGIYAGRDNWYKLLSWVNRLFGGAFLGTHEKRLEGLQKKLTKEAQVDFSKFLKKETSKFISANDFELNVNGKKFHVEWKNGVIQIEDKIVAEVKDGVVTYQNLKAFSSSAPSIFYAIEQKISEMKTEANIQTADIRDNFMKEFEAFYAVYGDDKPLRTSVKIQNKTYFIRMGEGLPLRLTIQENAILELQHGKSTLDGDIDGLSDDHIFVLEEIGNRMANRPNEEIAILASLKGISDDPESIMKSKNVIVNQLVNNRVMKFKIGDENYVAWLNQNVLNIQKKSGRGSSLGLLQVNNSIPDEAKHIFHAAVLHAYKESSIYKREYMVSLIEIRRDGLDLSPEWHLNELVNLFSLTGHSVKYIGEEGQDGGGLIRDHVGKLASVITGQKSLFANVDGSLKIPRICRDQGDAVLHCAKDESEVYQNIGKLLAMCNSAFEAIPAGRLFSDAVFKAAFSLSMKELEKPLFKQKDAQIRMAKIILAHLDKQNGLQHVKHMIKCYEILEQENLPDDLVFAVDLVGESFQNDEGLPDMDKINTNKDSFKKALFDALMKDTKVVDELNGVPLGSILDPIFHIAKGMSLNRNWDKERVIPVDAFSTKVQGSIDRDKIEACIKDESGGDHVIDQKIRWLKEWIHEASDAEIQAFLKFVTGSTSLAQDTKIKIYPQPVKSPIIGCSTCNMNIFVSNSLTYNTEGDEVWDNTKERFIRNLKVATSVEGFQKK